MSSRFWRVLSWMLLLGVAAYFGRAALSYPSVDWDMIPYTSAIVHGETRDPAEVHARTWAIIKEHVTQADLNRLLGGRFGQEQYAKPAVLFSQLQLYEIKYGYVLLLRAVARVVDPVHAILCVSLIGALATLIVLFAEAFPLDGVAVLGWLPLIKLFNLSFLSNFPTPDSIATGVYSVGLWALLANRRHLAVVLFVAAAFIRPDNIILNVMLCAAALPLRAAGVLLFGSAAAFLIDSAASGYPGWGVQFQYNFVSIQADVKGVDSAVDLSLYGTVIKQHLIALVYEDWLYMAGACCILIIVLARDQPLVRRLMLALVAAGVVKFFVYPSNEGRLYSPLLFGLALLVLHAAAGRTAGDRRRSGDALSRIAPQAPP